MRGCFQIAFWCFLAIGVIRRQDFDAWVCVVSLSGCFFSGVAVAVLACCLGRTICSGWIESAYANPLPCTSVPPRWQRYRETHEFYLAPLRALERATWLPYTATIPLWRSYACRVYEILAQPATCSSRFLLCLFAWNLKENFQHRWNLKGSRSSHRRVSEHKQAGYRCGHVSSCKHRSRSGCAGGPKHSLPLSLSLYKFMANIAKLTSKYVGSYWWIVGEAKTATWVTRKYQTNRSTLPTNMSQRNALLAIF